MSPIYPFWNGDFNCFVHFLWFGSWLFPSLDGLDVDQEVLFFYWLFLQWGNLMSSWWLGTLPAELITATAVARLNSTVGSLSCLLLQLFSVLSYSFCLFFSLPLEEGLINKLQVPDDPHLFLNKAISFWRNAANEHFVVLCRWVEKVNRQALLYFASICQWRTGLILRELLLLVLEGEVDCFFRLGGGHQSEGCRSLTLS